jgi:membrane fusion protein (multidrug efflux system)
MTTEPKTVYTRKRLLIAATLAFIVLGAAYALWWFFFASHYESTDDAYVHGNLVQVTTQIPGTVTSIQADDTQIVTKGAVLIKLDPTDTSVAMSQAQAALAQAVRHTRSLFVQNDALQADIAISQANVDRVQVDLGKAQNDLKRRQALSKTGGISGEEILHAQTAVKTAESQLAQAKASLAASRAALETNEALTSGTTVAAHPDVQQAAQQLRKAWLANARTELPAPVSGMIAQRSVQVGQHVAPGTPLMTVVPLQQMWVEANFKEVQVTHIKPGQNATLTADVYGSKIVYQGKVQGLAAGTGSAFALLPAQNATGNWIKVVQRVPVRIALDPKQLQNHPLRVGLSMTVDVDLSSAPASAHPPAANTTLETTVFTHDENSAQALIDKIIQENLAS